MKKAPVIFLLTGANSPDRQQPIKLDQGQEHKLNRTIDPYFKELDMSTAPSPPFSAPTKQTSDPNAFTLEQVKEAFPSGQRTSVTQSFVDKINAISTDEVMRDNIRDNFIGYINIVKDGKYKAEQYLEAVTYVSYKLSGHTDKDAYAKTFPDRYTKLVAAGTPEKVIASYVSQFKKGKLVNLIYEQSMIPTYVLNQDIFQEAINAQATLMRTADSEKVRMEAANSLLTHLKKPDAVKGGLNINLSDTDKKGMAALTDAITALAQQQQSAIAGGRAKVIDVAATPLFTRNNDDD